MKLTFSSYSLTDLANMADNREYYRTRIKSPDISLKEHKSLDETLKYLEQFPPGVEHFKVKAQKFEIYSVEDVIWKASDIIPNKMSNQCGEQKSKLIYPVGKDRLIHSVDFGNLVYASAGKPVEKLLEKNVKYYLNDNEFILGDRYTISALGNFEFPSEYFEVVSETIDQDYMIIYKLKKKYPKKIEGYYYLDLLLHAIKKDCREAQLHSFADKHDGYNEAIHEVLAGNIIFLEPIINYNIIYCLCSN